MSTSIKTSNNLSFLAWNINGLSFKSLGDKSQLSFWMLSTILISWYFAKLIYTCGLYIPPCNLPYFNVELFEELENDIEIFSFQASILLMGDLKARTGKFSDSVCKEGNNVITKDQSEFSLCPTQRNSFDNELNSQGKRLLEICKSADLRILNGRVRGDSLGRVTFHVKNWVSTCVVDYAVCDQDLLSHVANFVVKDPLHLSDHSPITTWLNINKKTSYNHTILEEIL